MAMAEAFIAELTNEAKTTRRVLERVPESELAWRPHPRSMSLGQLAYHIAALPRGIADLLAELSVEPPRVPLPENVPVAEILANLEQNIPYATERLASWGDAGLAAMWRMTRGDRTLLELPRAAMVRSVMLNHWYHHRGQLTVYLRLLDVPLPSVYGPSADEQVF
ncbi:MAG TPA: DinB family protein [Thermoanaerobaculia bacterium]|nr:DinB family protein [Thermoanaerobaculia bacterium]